LIDEIIKVNWLKELLNLNVWWGLFFKKYIKIIFYFLKILFLILINQNNENTRKII